MNIAVLMKPVLDSGVYLSIDDTTMEVAQKDQASQWVVNPADRSALEVALDLKRSLNTASVHAISYVPEERTEAVYYALARGADSATIISSDKAMQTDAAFSSVVLAMYLKRQPVDIILCGNESLDTAMACIGPFIAQRLGLPHVTQAVSLDLSSGNKMIIVQRRLEKGNREKLECSLPAVVAVDPMIAPSRYASVYAIHNAGSRDIQRFSLKELGLESENTNLTELTKIAPPRPRPKRTFIPDAKLSAAERMKMIRSGGMTKKKQDGDILAGSPEEIADGIFTFLQEKGFLG